MGPTDVGLICAARLRPITQTAGYACGGCAAVASTLFGATVKRSAQPTKCNPPKDARWGFHEINYKHVVLSFPLP